MEEESMWDLWASQYCPLSFSAILKLFCNLKKKILKIYDYWTHCLRLAFALCVKQQKGLRIIYFHFSLLPSV